ncbi:efflux RND transporter permease subunit [Desulfobotulus sp. H1]|uniref:Efflux RND transporter permease subunit n=1 Tax=Desulfobotulus pelophilus TaxID=2823377 RepID=A0ABT3N6V9_9BACT|nr:efflux RND transporter permease subunit [Desulfobotulus pelophilus]MCW7753179.1 efflux RND transporter permease subunit [Desulfobotulus pelophilus]
MNHEISGDRGQGPPTGVVISLVRQFLSSKLSPIVMVAALALGFFSVWLTPKEEEPQIVVPLADIFVDVPGASAKEVEQLVATPLERLLWQIDGVEYVYSMARRDRAVVTVRFYVGEDREAALVRLHNRIMMNQDLVPSIVRGWLIRPVEIDDVPIVNFTLHSAVYDDHALHRMAGEVLARLSEVKNVSRTEMVGGRRHEVRVSLLPERMMGLGVDVNSILSRLALSDVSVSAGRISQANRSFVVGSDSFLKNLDDVASLVVGVHGGRPVYLKDIALIEEMPEDARCFSRLSFGPGYQREVPDEGLPRAAVTLGVAKKRGTNAVTVADAVVARMEKLQKEMLPHGVALSVTRNYGETAREKVSDLLLSLAFAVVSVVLLLALTLGWREALVVAVAVPLSFSLALFVNYLAGYTINRVTLFALILSLGLVVDDPITNVDNIQRNIRKGELDPKDATLMGVREVLSPVLMSTVAIILCFVPLFFITGMMGPYMAPMAVNVPLTVIFSTLWALTIVPWLSWLLLKRIGGKDGGTGQRGATGVHPVIERLYRKIMTPFLHSRQHRYALLGGILLLFGGCLSLVLLRQVPLKLLPFDNKAEFQIVLDMPEGTTLEATDAVVREFEYFLRSVPEVREIISFTGTASPMDFNGMVRKYYLRQGPHLADIRVNLVHKSQRNAQSHGLVLRLRPDLESLACRHGASMQLVEVPPGPPVLATLVAEVYGREDMTYDDLLRAADHVRDIMLAEPFVTDVDIMAESPHERMVLEVDREKAALHGISVHALLTTLETAVGGSIPATLHREGERSPLPVRVTVPREVRSSMAGLGSIPMATPAGVMVPLSELVSVKRVLEEGTIHHKNMERVVYVLGEMAGKSPAEGVIDLMSRMRENPPAEGIRVQWAGEGEWKITQRVFRDMGLAFAGAMLGIYLLLVIQSGSFGLPLLIMMAIPLTLLGILPGFWLLNLVAAPSVGPYVNPVFFTATSMIGMIALGGIVIRNSLVLVEFIQEAVAKGMVLSEAILQSGAIRLRPIVLTALTTAIGASPITLDPVFSGLAWALIFGLFASTLFTLLVVPVTYYALFRHSGGERK